jgi:hypothetical protein
MKTWNEKVAEFDVAGKPLTKALLDKASADLSAMGEACVLALGPSDSLDEMLARAVSADISALLLPSLMDRLNASGEDLPFPRDRLLAFVCGIWFLTAAVPRLNDEGIAMDMHDLARELGRFFFMPYDEENREGLVKIGIQYWKELREQPPVSVIEWDQAFSQMVFIHYEQMTNRNIDLGDFDLAGSIGKMLTIFLSSAFTLPSPPGEDPETP